jgi:uncharacterized membrane protein
MTRILWALYGATLVVAIAIVIIAYPALPDPMVSRLNFQGEPTQWLSRRAFVALWMVSIVMVNMWVPIVKLLVRTTPDVISVPNRAYWFATEERRRYAVRVTERMLGWMFILTNLFLISAFVQILQVNLRPPAGGFVLYLLLYALAMTGAVVQVFRSLRLPPDAAERAHDPA